MDWNWNMRYWTPEYWKGAFCFTARDLVNPQSELAQRYPHLYQKKNELFGFSDSPERGRNAARKRMNNMCSEITDQMDVYGTAGQGSFGSVFLARERGDSNNQNDPESLRHYAVKVQQHTTLLGAENAGHRGPPNGPVPDNRESLRYVPEEALIMLFLTDSDRFPTLDAVYTHDRYQAIVMSPCIDYNTERQSSPPNDPSRRFPAFTARYLLTKDHKPLLNPSEGRKVATQLFQAMRQLADMNAWHNDISVNNILVDENLNAQMIDLGDFGFALEERDFFERHYMYVPFQEYQLSPELAQYISNQVGSAVNFEVPHDARHESMWKFATMIYGILHGFWPWNEASKDGGRHPDLLNHRVYTDPKHLLDRRHRILNAPLPIDENLPQDCKDVLRALFSKNPEDRPTLAELEGYPWFSQWARETQFFERPFSRDFQKFCSRRKRY
ncbi:hypothetical protein PoHVEF18_002530 [Penicillium ochrochloron]